MESKQVIPVLDINWCMIALKEVNRKVAACFSNLPVEVKFKFVNYIKVEKVNKKTRCVDITLGTADIITNTITLLAVQGWQETAIHELVHIYRPNMSEKEVRKTTIKVISYLKSWRD